MKILLPVNEQDLKTELSPSFGRAPFYMVHETETNQTTFIENMAATSPGGAGIKAAQSIVDLHADVVITPRCGENAADVLKEANIRLYQSISDTALHNIEAFMNNTLAELTQINPGMHGHGG